MTEVHVRCGVYEVKLDLAGRSVGELRHDLGEALSIDPLAVALIDGIRAQDIQILAPGNRLEFVRAAGQKGRIH